MIDTRTQAQVAKVRRRLLGRPFSLLIVDNDMETARDGRHRLVMIATTSAMKTAFYRGVHMQERVEGRFAGYSHFTYRGIPVIVIDNLGSYGVDPIGYITDADLAAFPIPLDNAQVRSGWMAAAITMAYRTKTPPMLWVEDIDPERSA